MAILYDKSPLPFQGQKRNWLKIFRDLINQCPDDAVYVDLFGGSGLLSNNIKALKPNARVIYNDYDYFVCRLRNITKNQDKRAIAYMSNN